MGGSISCESKLSEGTTFKVELVREIVKEKPKGTAEQEIRTNMDCLKGKRVLMAEDNEINALVAKQIMEKAGIIVETAFNGAVALQKFKNSEAGYYDLILMDVRMPVMDGLQTTAEIRKLKRIDAERIPIIAMTADAFTEDVAAALDVGMNGHIAKPIELEVLYKTLAKAFAERERDEQV